MKIKQIFCVALVSLLLTSTFALGEERDLNKIFGQGSYTRHNAKIMAIDTGENVMIIAEKTVKWLQYVDQNGVTQYQTQLLSSSGKELSITDFKIKDRVIVQGVKLPDGTIIASDITKTE